MNVVLMIRMVGLLLISSLALAQNYQEGNHFRRLKNVQPVESGKKIEVIEFFSYGCPHCRSLDPKLHEWMKKNPEVHFRRVPAAFRPEWTELGRAYYTLEALSEHERLAKAVYEALHDKKISLHKEDVFLDWAAKQGLDRTKVSDVYKSFGINSKIQRLNALTKAYAVDGVPLLVVDGKYVTQPSMPGIQSDEKVLVVLSYLVERARKERN